MAQAFDHARGLLKSVFGYDDFRPGQAEVVASILAGRDVLAVMPTGSGKSMCYQLPALADGALTIVVSPLIALMRDQVRQLNGLGVAAATLNSHSSDAEIGTVWDALEAGTLRLLFVSPERLMNGGLAANLGRLGARRIAVDEAHCVSEWGHDFRPEYREIRRAAEAMGVVQTVALTATADRGTRADIVERLFGAAPEIFVHSFDRPNLTLAFAAKDQPRRQLATFLDRHRGASGIVYCASRDRTERLADYFAGLGHDTVAYHAGLDATVRHANGDRFLREDGVVAVATVAFGMGINKPDIRFVAHADMPGGVEAYYQEIGRAGRDGLPADTLTLFGLDDMAFRRRQIDEKAIDAARRSAEHRRLDAMTALCEAPVCRRQTLLAYFDEAIGPCGHCDLCAGAVPLYDGTIEAQKALSAVVRTGQRFGAGYLADLLRGETTEPMRRNRHHELKTFGVGRDLSKREWSSVFRQLFAARALATASDEHGGFCLTEKGEAILRGRETISLRRDASRGERATAVVRAAGSAATPPGDALSERVLAELKRVRRALAKEEGVPAFMVFADRTLIDMAASRPATLDQLRRVHGVGERKLQRYGDAFLQAVADAIGG